jgi:hypothetical protein
MSLFGREGRVCRYEQLRDASDLETRTMRPTTLTLTGAVMLAAALLTACDRATDPDDSSMLDTAILAFAAGSKVVDPAALTPAPLLVGPRPNAGPMGGGSSVIRPWASRS